MFFPSVFTHYPCWFRLVRVRVINVKHNKIFAALILAVILMFNLVTSAAAIGPGTGGSKIRVNDEVTGPYVLLVATSPLPVTTGQMSVWVRVTSADTNELRRDATVMIQATPRDGGETLTTQGTHQNAGNNFDYVAHLEVDQAGQWDVVVTVADDLGQAEVGFAEIVTGGRSAAGLISLAIPFVVAAVVVGVYLWRKSGAA